MPHRAYTSPLRVFWGSLKWASLPAPRYRCLKGQESGEGGRLGEVTGRFSSSLCVSLFRVLPESDCSEPGLAKGN